MTTEKERREQLQRTIRENQRSLRDPYVQDKWVEREAIEKARRELDRLDKKRS